MSDHRNLLKQLVAAPFGQAEEILKAKGLWDEKRRAPQPGEKTYRVRVYGQTEVTAIVKVEASSDEEAMEKAEEIASDASFDWDIGDGDTEVSSSFIESCRP